MNNKDKVKNSKKFKAKDSIKCNHIEKIKKEIEKINEGIKDDINEEIEEDLYDEILNDFDEDKINFQMKEIISFEGNEEAFIIYENQLAEPFDDIYLWN